MGRMDFSVSPIVLLDDYIAKLIVDIHSSVTSMLMSRLALDMRDVNAAESDFYEAEDMLERTLRFRGICDDEDEELQGPALEGIIGITQSSAPPTSSPVSINSGEFVLMGIAV